ncbi:MAG: anti-sigma factor antagonist [Oscillatoriales cyanobacterium]|jgi:anti-anti-sigma factor|nr:MAG: anti-sigma factor antagonist [Oscillatoriales cyanobacterium]
MAVVLLPKGRLDLIGATKLQQNAERHFLSARPPNSVWILDLSQIEFVGHAGIRLLVALRRLAQQRNSRLVLRHPTAAVRSVLEVALIGELFEVWMGQETTGEQDSIYTLDMNGDPEDKGKVNTLMSNVMESLQSKLSQSPRSSSPIDPS